MAVYSIRQPKDTYTEEEKLEFFVKLVDGEVMFCAEDNCGREWIIAVVDKSGRLRLASGIGEDVGLVCDGDGHIDTYNEK